MKRPAWTREIPERSYFCAYRMTRIRRPTRPACWIAARYFGSRAADQGWALGDGWALDYAGDEDKARQRFEELRQRGERARLYDPADGMVDECGQVESKG